VLILLTNDDGIAAPGLLALHAELSRLGEVYVVAPSSERSGVSHSLTYLTPLMVKEVYRDGQHGGWAVDGNPADCVKLGITKICPRKPDLVVSGINNGLNAGVNILYSGTVAATVEAGFFNVDAVAVSMQNEKIIEYDKGARIAVDLIQQIVAQNDDSPGPRLYNMNIPTRALSRDNPEVHVVPMESENCHVDDYEQRHDPWGRQYYWIVGNMRDYSEHPPETDLAVLARGQISLTPLQYDLTRYHALDRVRSWDLTAKAPGGNGDLPAEMSTQEGVAYDAYDPSNDETTGEVTD